MLHSSSQVGSDAEGEARRYFDHALTLRDTIRFLRHNRSLCEDADNNSGQGIDLLRCESLLSLDPETRSRVLNRNYRYGCEGISAELERESGNLCGAESPQ